MPGSSNFEDLIVRDTRANQPAAGIPGRLYYVTDESVLERDNGSAWQNVEAAGRTLISEQTPTGTGTVTFSGIPGTYKSLELEIIARTGANAATTSMYLRFNNDTTDANYRRDSLTQGGATVNGGSADNPDVLIAVANTGLADNASYGVVKIPYYALTVFHKAAHIRTAYRSAAATSNQNFQSVYWENTAAITRIDVVTDDASNYVAGTTFRLYGVN